MINHRHTAGHRRIVPNPAAVLENLNFSGILKIAFEHQRRGAEGDTRQQPVFTCLIYRAKEEPGRLSRAGNGGDKIGIFAEIVKEPDAFAHQAATAAHGEFFILGHGIHHLAGGVFDDHVSHGELAGHIPKMDTHKRQLIRCGKTA